MWIRKRRADGDIRGRELVYGFGEPDTLVPAYAATVHKSQGSEYPAVIIPVLTQHYAMLRRNLLYTGVTRGKRLVVLVGQKKAVAIAVRNVSGRQRAARDTRGAPISMPAQAAGSSIQTATFVTTPGRNSTAARGPSARCSTHSRRTRRPKWACQG